MAQTVDKPIFLIIRGLGFGKDAEIERPKALQDAKPTKRSYRDREFALSYKKQTFSTS